MTSFLMDVLWICYSRECEATRICADYVHGKKSIKEYDASDVLRDSNLDKKVLFWWRCLQDLSNFRRKLKKRVPEVPFLDIEDELFCLDKVWLCILYNIIKYIYQLLIIFYIYYMTDS